MAKAKKLPSGNWRVQVYVGKNSDGKRIYESFTESTKKEAEFKAAQFLMGLQDKKKADISFHDAASEYIALRSHVLSPWSITTYKKILERDLKPMHQLRVKDIDQDAIQRFINHFSIDHSPKTVRSVHGFLSTVLSHYAPDLRISTKLPGKVKSQITIPTDDQIIQAIQSAPGHMPLIIQIAATLGLRRAEICALTWADIGDATISITKALAKDPGNKWVVKAPKSYAGQRTIPIPASLRAAILAKRPAGAADAERIFPVNPDYITKRWCILCKENGFHCRFHDLRHYNASVMLSLGVPDKYAMARMGHATTNMLKTVYQHLIDEKEREEAAKIDAYMAKFEGMQHEMQHGIQKNQ